jgi:hypothetical protein
MMLQRVEGPIHNQVIYQKQRHDTVELTIQEEK